MKILFALVVLAMGGCQSSAAAVSLRGSLIVRGTVESIQHSGTMSGMRVVAGPDSPEPCGIQATLDGSTRYFQRTGTGDAGPALLGMIEEGTRVSVYVDGAVMESCPVQATASAVVIERAG